MAKRRSRGDGGLYWSESRQRWIAEVTTGYTPAGKRIVRKASGKTKTEAKDKLKELVRDLDDGLPTGPAGYTVAEAVSNWLTYGLSGRHPETVKNYRYLADGHLLPLLGKRKLRELSAEDVDEWLADVATRVSTRTLRLLHSILNRSVRHSQARDKVKRNVVALCEIPTGQEGRPSKSLNFEQAEAVLKAAENSHLHAYVVLSLLIGARTEELRALTWNHVNLGVHVGSNSPTVHSISVWRSVRAGGDTKTRKSRRTLAMPIRCVVALRLHRIRQAEAKRQAGQKWEDHDLVFTSSAGTPLDAHNVRRDFRQVIKSAGLTPKEWTPREMRHSFVSLLSDSGVRLEDIARLCGHSGTAVTEQVYRHQIRPVILEGATAMDRIFAPNQ
ncbi:site-specific integrase [Amycolatopsis acidiphila]|uniref:Site-specific integrase n=1 Tax=Amycolatopsis acidiphila TaxID=715473 RepID=A0A558A148_9PSEU|nr:site-specific integrase [Amycolatopsis acidiphila]TVT17975.1 site-specific integrase [Amycolatopsis acidiphila]UIJ57877.1 site-specific integrase [Amycolatopsis acidiphila]UIJ57899.1 site-specific integrase [Amycolatopsis acidiphila]GHG71251.1 site-specific integrase [Amycolatopsis acidiphila]